MARNLLAVYLLDYLSELPCAFYHRRVERDDMDLITVLWVSIALFASAAAGGLIMAGIRVRGGRNPPAWLAMMHGLLAGAGLTLLLFAAFTVGLPTYALWALILLVLAALGGGVMSLGYRDKGQLIPKAFMYVHAFIAVAGFILLVVAAIR